MIPKFKNISDAMLAQRDTDKIIAILDNRFCLSRGLYTNGNYSDDIRVQYLFKGKVYLLCSLESFKRAYKNYMENVPNFEPIGCVKNYANEIKSKIVDNRKTKQQCRQLKKALENYVNNKLENHELISKWL